MGVIVPAVLPSSRRELEEKLALFARIPSVSRVQIDVVDGRFAAPASWPYTAPEEFRQMTKEGGMLQHIGHLEYEIDLMCRDALVAIEPWLALGASRFTLHAESMTDLPQQLAAIRERLRGDFTSGLVSLGLALNIASDLALIEPCLGEISYVQFMGIARIGRQRQPFDERVYEKVRRFDERHPEVPIQVDGGVSPKNAKKLFASGASYLVVGSDIALASDPAAEVAELEKLFGA